MLLIPLYWTHSWTARWMRTLRQFLVLVRHVPESFGRYVGVFGMRPQLRTPQIGIETTYQLIGLFLRQRKAGKATCLLLLLPLKLPSRHDCAEAL